MNIGALIGQLCSARAEVARAFIADDKARITAAIAHHDALQAEMVRRIGVLGGFLAQRQPLPPEVAEAWNGVSS